MTPATVPVKVGSVNIVALLSLSTFPKPTSPFAKLKADFTSELLNHSIDVPSTLKKSLSATPLVNVAISPLAIPEAGTVGI